MKKMQIIQLKKMIIKILIIKLQLFLKEVKKLLILKELGPVCEDISKKFKDACESKNGAELQMVSACDSKGNLEMFCSYTDPSANFVTLLADFTNEVETNCNSEYLDASVYLQNQW